MRRSILATLCVSLLASLPAASVERPSVASVDAQQKRTNVAICAKADADGDSYRPFVCTPRCDCFAAVRAQGNTPSSCQQTSPGLFDVAFLGAPGTCNNGACSYSSFATCLPAIPLCPAGESCVSGGGLPGFPSVYFCKRTCASNAGCPQIVAAQAHLSGVGAPDSPNAVQCTVAPNLTTPSTTKINSNDALECLTQVEAATGPCQ